MSKFHGSNNAGTGGCRTTCDQQSPPHCLISCTVGTPAGPNPFYSPQINWTLSGMPSLGVEDSPSSSGLSSSPQTHYQSGGYMWTNNSYAARIEGVAHRGGLNR